MVYEQDYYSGQKALSREEFDKLMLACDDQEDKILILTCVSLGLRRSDVVRIEVKNLDFVNHTITYNEKKKKDRIRVVPLSPKLENEMKIFIKLAERNPTDKLFSFGERQSWNRFNTCCDKAGIPRRPIHSLRATCCKFYLEKGLRPEQVADIIGDTVETVMRHYVRPSNAELQDLVRNKEVI